jgi:hypothetical protein
MDLKYLLKIFILVFLILYTIMFINLVGLTLNDYNNPKTLKNVLIMEGLENPLTVDACKAFCQNNQGAQLETACNAFTQDYCNSSSCCIWTNDNKCKAGNKSGPLFNTDSNGKTVTLDYYYFQNNCYGDKCPNNQVL